MLARPGRPDRGEQAPRGDRRGELPRRPAAHHGGRRAQAPPRRRPHPSDRVHCITHPGPDRRARPGQRVELAEQRGEHRPDLLRTGGEPAQPAAHRRGRPPELRRDPPVTGTRGLRGQRRTDHRDPIRAAQQARHRQQHVRAAARTAPAPLRSQRLDPSITVPHRPRPGMPPGREPVVPTTRAPQHPGPQPLLNHHRIGPYHQHRCLQSTKNGPPDRPRNGRAVARPEGDHLVVAHEQAQSHPDSSKIVLTRNVVGQPAGPHPERRSTATRISPSLAESERASSVNQLSTRARIRYASRKATARDRPASPQNGDTELGRLPANALIRARVTVLGTHRIAD